MKLQSPSSKYIIWKMNSNLILFSSWPHPCHPDCTSLQWLPPSLLLHLSPPLSQWSPVHVSVTTTWLGQPVPAGLSDHNSVPCIKCDNSEGAWECLDRGVCETRARCWLCYWPYFGHMLCYFFRERYIEVIQELLWLDSTDAVFYYIKYILSMMRYDSII